jgi:hypothetical protein
MFSKGQGTIEYLVILGIIILIGLVVVGLSTNFLEQTEQINASTNRVDSSIGITGISITENILDDSGNGAVTLQNTSNDQITLTKITVNGIDNNYNKIILRGDSATFILNNLSCTCSAGETNKTCTYTIYFTQNGVITTRTKTLTANCSSNFSTDERATIPTPPTCTSFTYSDWGDCNAGSLQGRTIQTTTPNVCTGGTPTITQSCTYIIPCVVLGEGTEGAPIKLCDCTDLPLMDANAGMRSKYFSLGRDINCSDATSSGGALWNSGAGFDPIGAPSTTFTGGLDGNNHIIYNLYINRPATDYIGLFGTINSATITNIGLVDHNIIGKAFTGGLIGIQYFGTTTNNYTTGTTTGTNNVGGLNGFHFSGTATNNYTTGNTNGTIDVGGLIGEAQQGSITNSYSDGNTTGTDNVGGLIGKQYAGTTTNNYTTGTTTGTTDVGGLIGYQSSATITSNYWDITLTTQNNCHGSRDTGCTSTDNNAAGYYGSNGIPFTELSWSDSTWTARDNDHPIFIWQ